MGNDAECMDVGLHHFADCVVNQLVSLYQAEVSELARYDCNAEVAFAFAGSGMAGVEMAFVFDLKSLGVQSNGQAFANSFDP